MERFVDINQILRESTCENLEQVLRLYNDNGYFKENKTIVSNITNSLGNRQTVNEGLVHLGILLQRCSTEILVENGMTWVISCIRACENEDANIRNLAYVSLASLFKAMSKLPDFTKLVSNNSIAKLIDCIMKDETLLTPLYCLEVCLEHLPGACGTFRPTLEKYLLNHIKENKKSKVILAAKCMHLLQQTGGGGMKGVNHKMNWEKQFRMTINSLHSLMDIMYANTMEIVSRSNDELCLSLPPFDMPENPAHQISEVSKRFHNLCCFLQVMLTEPFPVAKRVQPDLVLHVINRGLAVTGKTLARVSTDNIILNAFLPCIQDSLLKTLDALIFCAGRHLISYSNIICSILMRVLQWTQEMSVTPHRKTRIAAYETLINWIKITNLSSFIEQHDSEIITTILFDITPRKTQVKLSGFNENNLKNECKREEISEANINDEKMCCLALDCFQKVLSASGLFLKPAVQKGLQTNIASMLLRLQSGQFNDSIYYRQEKCRKTLYKVFFSLVLHPSSRFPPPTHEGVIIFSKGQLDSNYEIADMCGEMLCAIKKIIQTNSLNKDENKGLVLNQANQVESPATVDATNPSSVENNCIPNVEDAIILDSTDISASDAEIDTGEDFVSQETVKVGDEIEEIANSQNAVNNFVEPNILTSVNCASMNGTAISSEDIDGPMLIIPNDDDEAMKIDENCDIPAAKRRKITEDNVVLPSCEEIVAGVKDLKEHKDLVIESVVSCNNVISSLEPAINVEQNSLPIITDVVSVTTDETLMSNTPVITNKLPESAVANLSVDEMMSSFVSEINDDI